MRVPSTSTSSHTCPLFICPFSFLFFLLLLLFFFNLSLLPILSFSLFLADSELEPEPESESESGRIGLMETMDEEKLERIDYNHELDLESTSSGLSSIISNDDFRSSSSSGDISVTSSSSGEIPAVIVSEAVEPRSVDIITPIGSLEEQTVTTLTVTAARRKCVGRTNRPAAGVHWGITSVIGRRREMEDAIAVKPGFVSSRCDHVGGCTAPGSRISGEISPIDFFGVFDGHGGSQVAKFCAERMHEVIAEEWGSDGKDGYEWQKRWEVAFSNGFRRTDNEVVSKAVATDMVGSTAVIVVLSGCQIIASNCGDSRAVLCRRNKTIPLTVDQKPDREDELIRIESEGGKVINWMGARVLGVLAMSRSIGDRYLRPWIIPVPEISFTTRSDEDECLVLASDGLWDVMTNEEVGQVACHLLRRLRKSSTTTDDTPPAQIVANSLTEIAYRRNSCDNISIIVIDLKAKKVRPQRQ